MPFLKNARRYANRRLAASEAAKRKHVPATTEQLDQSRDLAPREIELRGAALLLQTLSNEREILIEGPAGTGKTIGVLYYAYCVADRYPGAQILMLRKVRASMAKSVLKDFESFILPESHPERGRINRENRKVYRHINGSEIHVGGMDDIEKILSTGWDLILYCEALESSEDEIETLTTRLRGDKVPQPQLICDLNPGHPKHHLNIRAGIRGRPGKMRRLISKHQDNPRWWDGNDWTEAGRQYVVDTLGALTGTRRNRFLLGHWMASTGIVYPEALEEVHWIDKFDVPDHWRRIWIIDFGYTNPFCWWEVAVDEDGRMYRVQEIYHTGLLVEEAWIMIRDATANSPLPSAIICDHDAEDRATFEKHSGMETTAAFKGKSAGIDAVKSRLKVAGDGKPRLFFVRNCLVHEPDVNLQDAKKPWCSDDEFAGYEWNPKPTVKGHDQTIDKDNHGMDVMRYGVAFEDGIEEYGVDAPIQVYSAPRVAGNSFY